MSGMQPEVGQVVTVLRSRLRARSMSGDVEHEGQVGTTSYASAFSRA